MFEHLCVNGGEEGACLNMESIIQNMLRNFAQKLVPN
jgi:hypothetical protein